jgi:acyl carrier protein
MGLDAVTLVHDIETKFEIAIEDRDASKIVTVGDLLDLVWKVVQESDKTLSRTLCDTEVITIIEDSLGIDKSELTRNASFVNDLGID